MPFDSTQYTLRRVWERSSKSSTRVAMGLLDAFIKYDSSGSFPHNVYNEIVALRLGQKVGVPLADGALVSTQAGPAYASLAVCKSGVELPDLMTYWFGLCAERYPVEAAALVAFDIWIGNFDRARNIKVNLIHSDVRIFRAFDHSHCLLGVARTRKEAIRRLGTTDIIVSAHPFYGRVSKRHVQQWIIRIEGTDDNLIDESCGHAAMKRTVSLATQKKLARALKARRHLLLDIIENERDLVFGVRP